MLSLFSQKIIKHSIYELWSGYVIFLTSEVIKSLLFFFIRWYNVYIWYMLQIENWILARFE